MTRILMTSLVLAASAMAVGSTQLAEAQASPRDKLLVSGEWLKAHTADKDLVVLQVGDKKEYDAGHIPGARLVGMSDLAAPMDHSPAGLILELPAAEDLHAKLEALGVSNQSRIVVSFGAASMASATRVILTLDAMGFGDKVALLDGGMPAWQAAGYPMSTEAAKFQPSKLAPLKMQERTVTADFVQAHLAAPGYRIIDARAQMFYDGLTAGGGSSEPQKKGHVKGAGNIPFMTVQNADQKVKSAEELAAMFKAAGVAQGDKVLVYCHIGQQGTEVVYAARTLGIDAKLYDGSFQDWSRRDLPVEVTAKAATP